MTVLATQVSVKPTRTPKFLGFIMGIITESGLSCNQAQPKFFLTASSNLELPE